MFSYTFFVGIEKKLLRCITCKVPITGIKIDVCLILLSLANRGNPPAFLIFCLFRVDLDNDQRANAAPRATWNRNAMHWNWPIIRKLQVFVWTDHYINCTYLHCQGQIRIIFCIFFGVFIIHVKVCFILKDGETRYYSYFRLNRIFYIYISYLRVCEFNGKYPGEMFTLSISTSSRSTNLGIPPCFRTDRRALRNFAKL